MKAYLIISGYDENCEVDSVFLNKEEAIAYVAAGNQIALISAIYSVSKKSYSIRLFRRNG